MPTMQSPLLPLTIAIGALAADSAGVHQVAFYLVLLAIPAAAGAALAAAGDLAEGRSVALRTIATAGALALLVLSSAARANAPVGGGVPAIAVSALLAALLAYASLGIAWLAHPIIPTAEPELTPAPAVAAPAAAAEPAADTRAA